MAEQDGLENTLRRKLSKKKKRKNPNAKKKKEERWRRGQRKNKVGE